MKELNHIKKLLIIVDMVNGFVKEGNMADEYISHIIPEQIKLINLMRKEDEGVVFIKDSHEPECREFLRYPKHCVIGTSEAELVDELKPFEKGSLVYEKNSTSAIFAPGFLQDIDKMESLEEVIIVGCCTDICDINLAIPLQNYFDQMDKNIKITVPINAVETFDSEEHRRELYNDMSFKFLRQSGINLVEEYK